MPSGCPHARTIKRSAVPESRRLQPRHQQMYAKQCDEIGGTRHQEHRHIASRGIQQKSRESGDEHATHGASQPSEPDHRGDGISGNMSDVSVKTFADQPW